MEREEAVSLGNEAFLMRDTGPSAGREDFKLWQPYGQDGGKMTALQLLFRKNGDGGYAPVLQQLKFFVQRPVLDASGNQATGPDGRPLFERVQVPATGQEDLNADLEVETSDVSLGNPGEEMQVLEQHFSMSVLEQVFDQGQGLRQDSLNTVYGRIRAKSMLSEKLQDIVYKRVDEERDAYLDKTGATSAQETGYFFNNGMYGENLCVNSRAVMMDRFSMKVAVKGSCGSHQRAAADHGRPIIAVEHLPPFLKFLLAAHGCDAYDHGRDPSKLTTGAFSEATAAAGMHENPLERIPYDPTAVRQAEPGRPVAPRSEIPLATRTVPGTAEDPVALRQYLDHGLPSRPLGERSLWRPRDAANLCLHVDGRPYIFHHPLAAAPRLTVLNEEEARARGPQAAQGTTHATRRKTPVLVSENLRLRVAVMKDGSRIPVGESELTPALLRDCEHLVMTHELPEGWGLLDDRKRPILDENGAPVRLLEQVIIKPWLSDSVRKELVHDVDQDGRVSPVYVDRNNRRVYPDRRPGRAEPGFVDERGRPAHGKVGLQYRSVVDQANPDIRFEITGIERWMRVPLPKMPGSRQAATEGPDKALCTYRKEVFRHTDRDFHQALYKLRDKLYYQMNCVHSQNPASGTTPHDNAGPEETAVSVAPNDRRMPMPFMPAWSRGNQRTHAISVPWGAPVESLILEWQEGSNRGMTGFLMTLITHQPHKDLASDDAGIKLNPDHIPHDGRKVDAKHLAQGHGNKDGVTGGLTKRKVQEGLAAEVRAAGAVARARRSGEGKETRRAAAEALQQVEQEWNRYIVSRSKETAESVAAILEGCAHPLLQDAAASLRRNAGGSGAFAMLGAAVEDAGALLRHAGTADRKGGQDARLLRLAAVDGALRDLAAINTEMRGLQRALDDPSAAAPANFYAGVQDIQTRFGQIYRALKKADLAGTLEEPAFVRLRQAIDGLAAWERLPGMLQQEVQAALAPEHGKSGGGAEPDVLEDSVLRLEDIIAVGERYALQGHRPDDRVLKARNEALATRYFLNREAPDAGFKPMYRLFLEQEYAGFKPTAPHEEDGQGYRAGRRQYWAEKDRLAAELEDDARKSRRTLAALRADRTRNGSEIARLEQRIGELDAAVAAWKAFRGRALADFETADDDRREEYLGHRSAALQDVQAQLRQAGARMLSIMEGRTAAEDGTPLAAGEPDTAQALAAAQAERKTLMQDYDRVRQELRQARRILRQERGRDLLAAPGEQDRAMRNMREEVDDLRAALAQVQQIAADHRTLLAPAGQAPQGQQEARERIAGLRETDAYSQMGIDELEDEARRLNEELDEVGAYVEYLSNFIQGREAVTASSSLARQGHVGKVDAEMAALAAAEAAAAPAEAAAARDEAWVRRVLAFKAAIASPGGESKDTAIREFVGALAEAGLLPGAHAGARGEQAIRDEAFQVLRSPQYTEGQRAIEQVEQATAPLLRQYAGLVELRESLRSAWNAFEESRQGRMKINYRDRTRRTQIADGLYAGMAANAALASAFAMVKDALKEISGQLPGSLAEAEAATALGLDATIGSLQIAAGANLIKDAHFTRRHLKGSANSTRPALQKAIGEYRKLAEDLKQVETTLIAQTSGASGNSPAAQANALQ